ncbi:glycosyltransferase family 4 protein [Atlantibacter hermannii]|uniref:glycosyltransferase family 4 protein n=1 Tax=Atlantibacter hermannii TaxID=565 RepID=UPI0013EEFDF9|nr:glycosyltransferase family 4 protein [Atlantibacter hermannii]
MMKVLHLYKTYYPDTFGGIEQVIFQLSEAGYKYGIESTTLSLSSRGNISNALVGNHSANYAKTLFEIASTPFSFSAIKRFKELAEQADIIHYHFPYPFMDMMHFMVGVKKPTVVSYHSDIVKQKIALRFYTPLMKSFLKSVDCIVAASPNYVKSSTVLEEFKHKVKVIPYGLDKCSYPIVDKERLDFWSKRVGKRFFLFIGAFRYYKGLQYLIQSLKNLDYPLVIMGSGPLESELKQLTFANDLKNTHFVGALPDEDKVALLELCYSVVFPSHLRSEAFGITLLEGAMYGKPLISCEIGTGTSFINIHNETGIVVKPSSTASLSQAMTLLWDNPQQAKIFGENAYKRYQQVFTSTNMANNYIEIYNELVSKTNNKKKG